MDNYISDGDRLTKTAPAGGVVSGLAYLIGGDFGVAVTTAAAGASFELQTSGVVEIVKATAADFTADGDVVYWDDTGAECESTGPADKTIGTSQGIYGTGVLLMKVKLIPIAA